MKRIIALVLLLTTIKFGFSQNVKISLLPTASGSLTSPSWVPVTIGSITKKVDLSNVGRDSLEVVSGTAYDTIKMYKSGIFAYYKLVRAGSGSSLPAINRYGSFSNGQLLFGFDSNTIRSDAGLTYDINTKALTLTNNNGKGFVFTGTDPTSQNYFEVQNDVGDYFDIFMTGSGTNFGPDYPAGSSGLYGGASGGLTLYTDVGGPVRIFAAGNSVRINQAANNTDFGLPTGRGTANYILTTDGVGGTSWSSNTDFLSPAGTATLTNKRINRRLGNTTSSATPTINTDNVDIYKLTAQTTDITSFTTNLTGTPVDGNTLEIQITGTAARAITWGASFASSTVTLPTTTISTSTLTVVFEYFTTSSYGNNKWICTRTF